MTYKLKKKIPSRGYPITSKYYPECHKKANIEELKEFGMKKFKQVNAICMHHPDELLGTNTIFDETFVSEIVPEKYRNQVDFHEKIEVKCMLKKRRNHK